MNTGPGPRAVAIIPARLGSTRMPEKILASETGRPLVEHVRERASLARTIERVVVATDHPRIADALTARGAEVVMTSPDHPNGTSRLTEASTILGLAPDAIVVNVQGDEPEVEPGAIDAAVELLAESDAPVSTIGSPFFEGEDPANPNIVKVVRTLDASALYFSRGLIPHRRDPAEPLAEGGGPVKHVGLYVYRKWLLDRYVTLTPTPLEQTEKLEQLRIMEHGYRIAVAIHPCAGGGIDTPEQYRAFVERWNRARA